jgi:AcrR family transcriptional regulator
MTLYRRFPDVRSLLAALMTREFSAILTKIESATTANPTARTRLVAGAVAAVRALTADPLMRTILDRDGALVLPYVVERLGTTQHLAEGFLRAQISHGHHDGSVRHGDADAQARAVLLIVQSFALSFTPATATLDPERLLAELTHVLDMSLRPVAPPTP